MARMRLAGLVSAVVTLCAAAPAAAHFPQHVDASVPVNGTVSETSSALPATAKSATITVKPTGGEDLFGPMSTVMARMPTKGARLLYCVALYQAFGDQADDPIDQTRIGSELRALLLNACIELAVQNPPPPQARAAAAACPVVPLNVPVKVSRTSAGYSVHVKGIAKRPGKSPLKVSCRHAGNALKIRLRPRSPGRTLRSVVGPELAIGFVNRGTAPLPIRTSFAVG